MLPVKWIGAVVAVIGWFGTAMACNAMPPGESKGTEMFEEAPVSGSIEPITMAAVGDVLLHDTIQAWAAEQPQGYFAAMTPVQDLLQAADITLANLEGPAAKNILNGREVAPPPTLHDGKVYSGYPLFNYHPSIVSDLRRLGVDIVQTANNHSLDRGSLGIDRTLDALDAAGMRSTGTRRSTARRAGYDWSTSFSVRRGERDYQFAVIACTYGTNEIADTYAQVLHCYDQREELLAQIRALRADESNAAVIVMPHWGIEYKPLPEPKQIGLAQDLANAGATAIIGSHPHVVQPEVMLTAADGRRVPMIYSLGNFVSRQIGLPRLTTIIYLLGFTPTQDGRLAATMTGWIPLRMKTEGGMSIDPLDRLSAEEAAPYLAHLLKTFTADNRLPADPAVYWNRGSEGAASPAQ